VGSEVQNHVATGAGIRASMGSDLLVELFVPKLVYTRRANQKILTGRYMRHNVWNCEFRLATYALPRLTALTRNPFVNLPFGAFEWFLKNESNLNKQLWVLIRNLFVIRPRPYIRCIHNDAPFEFQVHNYKTVPLF
jgi:hypothetical protein